MGLAFYQLMPIMPLYLVDTIHVQGSWLGLIMSIYVLSAILSRPGVAHLLDTKNRKTIYIICFILLSVVFLGYLVALTALSIFLLRFLHGLIWGGITASGPTLATDLIPAQRRGEGLGYFGVALTLSMCVGPILGVFIYDLYSFDTLVYLSFGLTALGALVAGFIRLPQNAPKQSPVVESPKGVIDRLILRVGIPSAINVILAAFSYGVVIVYAVLLGKQNAYPYSQFFFVFMGVGTLLSRFLSGKHIDRGRIAELSVISLLILAASMGVLALFNSVYSYFSAAFFLGIGFGIFVPTFQMMKLNMASKGRAGAANSTFFTAYDMGIGLGMLAGGKIYALLNIHWTFGIAALCNLVALLYFYTITHSHYKKHKNPPA